MQTYEEQLFETLNLESQLIENAHFIECTFSHCNFFEMKIKNCVFDRCSFRSCTCAGTDFKYTDLKNNDFHHCSLVGISWDELKTKNGITLPFTAFENCVLKYNYFVKLKLNQFSFQGNVMEECYFEDCRMEKTNFQGCQLKNTKFAKNNLAFSDFREARDYMIDVQTNKVKIARFSYPEAVNLLTGLGIILD